MMTILLWVDSFDLKLGLTITVVGIGVVFTALVLLNLIFNQLPGLLKIQVRRRFRKTKAVEEEECCPDISGDTNAAIALALHLYMNETHDKESHAFTIEKVSRRYSPWSSKIYGLRNMNFR